MAGTSRMCKTCLGAAGLDAVRSQEDFHFRIYYSQGLEDKYACTCIWFRVFVSRVLYKRPWLRPLFASDPVGTLTGEGLLASLLN